MYFPYLRGRQNELLALRELASEGLLGNSVIPIIEPVKFSSSLVKTLQSYIDKNLQISVILNPTVGSFSTDMSDLREKSSWIEFCELLESTKIIKSLIIDSDFPRQLAYWNNRGFTQEDLLVILTNRDYLDIFESSFTDALPKYVLIPDETSFKRRIKTNRVLLDDKFEKQTRNADYKNVDDEFFSEDHLFFREEGFEGFSDYSVIGEPYYEKGFAPYAVAIHIVYFDQDNSVRVRHFVSDSNEDISDPARKFYEAVQKLFRWQEKSPMATSRGLSVLLDHYHKETYPGLGSIKKLSIMHHIEIIGKFLDNQ